VLVLDGVDRIQIMNFGAETVQLEMLDPLSAALTGGSLVNGHEWGRR
jgi:hypothetical protein